MAKECCRDCRYCHALKELAFGRWIVRSCCTFWVETEPEDGYASWVQVRQVRVLFSEGGKMKSFLLWLIISCMGPETLGVSE